MKKLAFLVGLLIVIGGAIYGVLHLDKISAPPPFEAQPMTLPSVISIDDLDEYKFACVKQVLAQNNIESAYYKSGNMLKLMVFVSDEAMYEKLLADLKYYRLEFSIQ